MSEGTFVYVAIQFCFSFFPKIGFVVHLNLLLLFSKPVEINVKEHNGSYVKGHRLATATSMF